MRCRYCQGDVRVQHTDAINCGKEVRRYRRCERCRRNFKTIEVELTAIVEDALDMVGVRVV